MLSWDLLATERYLFFSNSDSSDLIWEAVKAVRGLFFLSSLLDGLLRPANSSVSESENLLSPDDFGHESTATIIINTRTDLFKATKNIQFLIN